MHYHGQYLKRHFPTPIRAALAREAIRTEYAARGAPLAKPTLRVFSWEVGK